MKRIIAIILIAVGSTLTVLGAVGWSTSRASRPELPNRMATPIGHEEPIPGATFSHGWNVANIGDCPFATAYASIQTFLGPPIGAFTGRSQDFNQGRLLCIPTNPPESQAILGDLGREYALLRGVSLTPNAEPAPPVQQRILEAMQTGYDPRQLFGRVLTPRLCDHQIPNHCEQGTDKQWLKWTEGPDAVAELAPLGCLLNQACERLRTAVEVADKPSGIVIPELALGIVCVLTGLALLLLGRRRQSGYRG